MAHIDGLNSSTFTTLAYVADAYSTRPATNSAWYDLFNIAVTGTGTLSAAITGSNLVLTWTTSAPTLTTGGNYYIADADDSDFFFQASDVTTTATTWTIATTNVQDPGNNDITAIAAATPTLFSTDGEAAVGSIREFPSLGTPANIVNVPVYGQSISAQVGGQADAPSLEFTLNYVPTDHAALDTLRRNGTVTAWRVRLATSENGSRGRTFDSYDDFYFVGEVASFEITPALNDSMQATISLTITGDFEGPFSEDETSRIYGRP